MLRECAEAYFEFYDVDPPSSPDALGREGLLAITALSARIAALGALIDSGQVITLPAVGGPSREAMIAAACAARTDFSGETWRFQLLDFLAQVERANRAPRTW